MRNLRRASGWRTLASLLILAATSLATGQALAEDNDRGRQLYALCSSCHGDNGEGARSYYAPAIAGLDEWYVLDQLKKFRSGWRATHFDDLTGMRMRPMALTLRTDEDVAAVAKYVASMPATNPEPQVEGGNPENGKALYVTCVQCHGPKGLGVRETFGPPLVGGSDWYLLDQLKKFRQGIRGYNPADVNGIMMRTQTFGLADEQAMKDVLAYVRTLSE